MKHIGNLFGIQVFIENRMPDDCVGFVDSRLFQYRCDMAEKFLWESLARDLRMYPLEKPAPAHHPQEEGT